LSQTGRQDEAVCYVGLEYSDNGTISPCIGKHNPENQFRSKRLPGSPIHLP
jgi:hypothetical protein